MRLLLDTHALLWWLADDRRLGEEPRDLLADPGNEVLVSVVSLWEIVIKRRSGKLDVSIDEIEHALGRQGIVRLDIAPSHLLTLASLPRFADHRDPFDHLLVAQAIVEGATFVSEDRHAGRYPVSALGCSDRRTGSGG